MRLIVECEHTTDRQDPRDWCGIDWCNYEHTITDPAAIREALARAGVLEVETRQVNIGTPIDPDPGWIVRYVSKWEEDK